MTAFTFVVIYIIFNKYVLNYTNISIFIPLQIHTNICLKQEIKLKNNIYVLVYL